ncbi:VanW family protein [Hoyosella rhizosphaerae]|uniref:Vanomycin resistance protein VanB n=1 Tax=Hoyosella rhizosphaerae TaxID=1755582 RepID=A0A916U4N3_9ACTN|nr:VanW family protein [Hoyosella rhizosphaerae]MBN4926669.1 VanW family protein [Hoyosella rhizosphaerae]GGC57399.1 vanomycin resistance protein VanB [Hoyosella rhizosphaerae]
MTDESQDQSEADDVEATADDPKLRSRTRILVIAGAAIVAIAGAAYITDIVVTKDSTVRGAHVLGTDIGGLTPAAAEEKLRASVGERVTTPITVVAGDVTTEVVPRDAGLEFDFSSTASRAAQQSLNPFTRAASFFRETDIPHRYTVDVEKLDETVERLAFEVNREPQHGGIAFDGAEPVVELPRQGQQLLEQSARSHILRTWGDGSVIELRTDVVPVELTEDDVRTTFETIAEPALANELVVKGTGSATATLPRDRIGEVLSFAIEDGELRHSFDRDAAEKILAPQLSSTEFNPTNATVLIGNSGPYVVADTSGSKILWDDTLRDFDSVMLQVDDRTVDAEYEEVVAEFRTADANALGIREVVAEFTTGGFAQASGINIRRAAQQVNGAIVRPGATFSLNGWTGSRGTAQGYVKSGIILNGRPSEAIGGGVSQFATTLFNAAYFAGMDDVEHQEHSYYIPRYPAGREATVWEGAIDVKFHNPYDTGVLIQSWGTASNVTVRIWGTKTVNVQSINGGRWAYTSPQRVTLPAGPNCVPSEGAQGFTTSDTRVIRSALTGAEISRSTRTVRYDPQPNVVCR